MKMSPMTYKIYQSSFKILPNTKYTLVIWPKIRRFCQSNKVSPNPVTLLSVIFHTFGTNSCCVQNMSGFVVTGFLNWKADVANELMLSKKSQSENLASKDVSKSVLKPALIPLCVSLSLHLDPIFLR